MLEISGRDATGRLSCRLRGEFNIYHAARLKDELLALLDAHQDLELDLGDADECDTSGVQILLLLKRTARARGKRLALVNHSSSVLEAMELLNLVSELGDPLLLLQAREDSA
ncbi:STAS domain-containing protein [Pseudomonas citronellolis]|uniref:STAS domain-containing protein n=1 Tax=Pseudomonas citronellolis TaxID=53408 RepID=UPI0023E413E8|nr:STAS domain-containing protein [Pseudomonas citronellolis]MDF3933768.1 STAS domain-containing protein [Pseudomonas citronellolis]